MLGFDLKSQYDYKIYDNVGKMSIMMLIKNKRIQNYNAVWLQKYTQRKEKSGSN